MADSFQLLSLCSGVGMLDEGVALGLRYLGHNSRVVGYCERDAYSAACLLARMEEKSLEPAPVWCGSLEDVAWGELCGHVDWITAGFPCQPHSTAGKRKSTEDERWIWPSIAGAIRQVRPRCGVFLENVPGLLSSGDGAACGEVFGDLAEMRFDAAWCRLSAAAAGASHQRQRVFILAFAAGRGFGELRQYGSDGQLVDSASRGSKGPDIKRASQGQGIQQLDGGSGGVLGHAEHGTPGNGRTNSKGVAKGQKRRRVRRSAEPSGILGDTERDGGRIDESGRAGAIVADSQQRGPQGIGPEEPQRRSESIALHGDWPAFAPGPSDPRWPDILQDCAHLAPAVEPGFRVLADGLAVVLDESRADALRCGGNGVVALQAAAAFVGLVHRIVRDANTTA